MRMEHNAITGVMVMLEIVGSIINMFPLINANVARFCSGVDSIVNHYYFYLRNVSVVCELFSAL